MSATIATVAAPGESVGAEAIADLQTKLRDRLITSQDEAYDDARRVWNGMIDRKPGAIARCRGVADVIDCVRWAADHNVLLAVRGGGHNVAGFGTCDGGLVIDLSPMNGIRIDLQRGTVRAGGGTTWGDLDRETQAFGLAAPGGIVSTTGIAGLTLGGGQGWLRRTYGMACDSLISADVITADGRLLVASEAENSDLFWALRGGGGNFGVVTTFEYRLHPVGPSVAFAGPVYSPDKADRVMEAFRDFFLGAPDELNGGAVWWTIPAVPGFPGDLHGQDVLILAGMSAGPPAAGETRLKPLREIAEPLLDLSATLPYVALQQLFDPFFPAHELRYYWKALYLADLRREVIAEVNSWVERRPSKMSMVVVNAVGGALGRVAAEETAIGARQAPFLLEILATWKEPEETEANVSWARECFAAMERFSTGRTNLNFPGVDKDLGFVRAAFGDNYDRLLSAKRVYDPTNVFHLNQNIDPGDSLS